MLCTYVACMLENRCYKLLCNYILVKNKIKKICKYKQGDFLSMLLILHFWPQKCVDLDLFF